MNHVLVVDDEAPMREALEAHFCRDGWNVTTAYGAKDAVAKFRRSPCSLVVTDMRMPDGDGLGVLRGIREVAPRAGVIFLTAFGSVPEAVRAIHEGACDYLVKPVCFDQLRQAAHRVLAQSSPAPSKAAEQGALIGQSEALRTVIERARQVASTGMDVLIIAESGTGKELLARFIHQASGRRSRPFVAVNCAAFPDTLLESELFGHARGAFTGAVASRPGKFELAHTGTLLLDEIGELPLPLQPKFLRALQEREVDRLGDTKPLRVDVRVIATTNQPLASLVEAGQFRADLFYRLNVVPLTIPPLRERTGDIAPLVDYFLSKHSSSLPAAAPVFSPELLSRLERHSWPGNVRELENFVRRIIALHPGETAGPEVFDGNASGGRPASAPVKALASAAVGSTMREMERSLLESTLDAQGGNRTRAAKVLGICPRTMRNKIREFGLPARRYL
jgi:DNA-binding NtrC family response regulator